MLTKLIWTIVQYRPNVDQMLTKLVWAMLKYQLNVDQMITKLVWTMLKYQPNIDQMLTILVWTMLKYQPNVDQMLTKLVWTMLNHRPNVDHMLTKLVWLSHALDNAEISTFNHPFLKGLDACMISQRVLRTPRYSSLRELHWVRLSFVRYVITFSNIDIPVWIQYNCLDFVNLGWVKKQIIAGGALNFANSWAGAFLQASVTCLILDLFEHCWNIDLHFQPEWDCFSEWTAQLWRSWKIDLFCSCTTS